MLLNILNVAVGFGGVCVLKVVLAVAGFQGVCVLDVSVGGGSEGASAGEDIVRCWYTMLELGHLAGRRQVVHQPDRACVPGRGPGRCRYTRPKRNRRVPVLARGVHPVKPFGRAGVSSDNTWLKSIAFFDLGLVAMLGN